jgi:CBS domain-containing protein
MPHIKDVLRQREVLWAETGSSVEEVARAMSALNVGAILVLDKRELRGVFSERDIMRRVVAEGRSPAATRVEEVMSTELTTVEEDAGIEEAMELMKRSNCRHLPVMRGQEVAGFISMRDLMLYQLEEKTEEVQQMRAYIQSAGA